MANQSKTPAENRNRILIEWFYHELWDRFDKALIPVLLTEDVRFRGSLGQNKSGRAEFAEYIDFVRRAFPDFSNEIEEMISEGDKAFVALHIVARIAPRSSESLRPVSGFNMPGRQCSRSAMIR